VFIMSAKDLACCREQKERRDKDPVSMSPRAGAVLCPMHGVVAYQDAVARRRLPPGSRPGVTVMSTPYGSLRKFDQVVRDMTSAAVRCGEAFDNLRRASDAFDDQYIVDDVLGDPRGTNARRYDAWLRRQMGPGGIV